MLKSDEAVVIDRVDDLPMSSDASAADVADATETPGPTTISSTPRSRTGLTGPVSPVPVPAPSVASRGSASPTTSTSHAGCC